MRKIKVLFITILIVMACFVACAITSIIILKNNIEKNTESNSIMLSEKLYEEISHDMEIPLQSAKSIASSTLVQEKIKDVETPDATVSKYLKSVKTTGEYETAFIATYKHIYYNENKSILFDDMDTNYSWYKTFIASPDNYCTRISYDKNNENIQTVFMQQKIYDADGTTLLGIAGIGISTASFEKIISNYETTYNVDIILLDETNNIKLSSKENSDLEKIYFDNVSEGDSEFKTYSDGSTSTTKEFTSVNWKLIILNDGVEAHAALNSALIGESVLFAIVLVVVIIASVFILTNHNKLSNALISKTRSEDKLKRQSNMDKLTGLYNRRAYDEFVENLEITDKTYVTVFDVDGLKALNDSIGHKAGDEAIRAASTAIRTSFKKSSSFRTGGDEFVTFTEATPEVYQAYLRKFKWAVIKYQGDFIDKLHVSAGSAKFSDYASLSVKQVIGIADERMYVSKQHYYEELENQKPSYLKKIAK